MKKLGLGGTEERSQSSSRQTTSAVSAEHSGRQPIAAQKASNLVPATVPERDEADKDTTVCVRESEVNMLNGPSLRAMLTEIEFVVLVGCSRCADTSNKCYLTTACLTWHKYDLGFAFRNPREHGSQPRKRRWRPSEREPRPI